MTSVTLAAILGGLTLAFYVLWGLWDGRKEKVATTILADTAGLGDVVPASLHPKVYPDLCIGSGTCIQACPEHDVIAIVDGIAKLINPLGCVGHGACKETCPVDAIELVYGSKTVGVELPRIDPHFETSLPGVYIIGELSGMGLIRNAVKQGAQVAGYIHEGTRRGSGNVLDAVVVGAGPAGIATSLGLMETGLRFQLLEREGLGGAILHYPRAKVVMTGSMDLPGYKKVKKRTLKKEQLIAIWEDIREKLNPPLSTGVEVNSLRQEGDVWVVGSNLGEVRAANVVLALGRAGSPRKLGVPGEEQEKVAYRLLDPDDYRGKHVLVVGGGNSAVESAIAFADQTEVASVAISYRKNVFARCRGSNRTRIDELINSGKVRGLLETNVTHIGENDVTVKFKDGSEETFENEAMIVQIGGVAPTDMLKSFGIELVTKYGET